MTVLRRVHAALAVFVGLALIAPSPFAQQNPSKQNAKSPAQTGQAPAVRVTTRLVQVNVIVQNSKGEPVTGLTQDDFTVLDHGEPQRIARFSVQTAGDNRQIAPEARAPNTFSNRFEERADAPTSATVILLDELNTRFADSAFARSEIVKLLRQIQPQDRVALYVLRGNLTILHDFTSDAAILLRALEKHQSRDSTQLQASTPEPPDTGNAELDAWLEGANERMGDFYMTNRVHFTLGAMEAIGRHLTRVPGRKNLIWVSGSFPITIGMDREQIAGSLSRNRQTYTSELENAGRALSDANIAVYPVDARGLLTTFSLNPNFNRPMSRGRGMAPLDRGMGAVADTHSTMNMIADRTGGRAFYNTNDVQGSIRRAINDSRVTYTLGFYPAHEKWNGEFRELKVRVKREGLRVRHRKGYVASADTASTEEQHRAAIRDAAIAPLHAAEIGLQVRVEPASAAGVDTVVVYVNAAPRDVTLTLSDGRWKGAVDLLFILRAADGTAVTNWGHRMHLNLTEETRTETMREGLRASKHIAVPASAAELRVIVRDLGSGALGSVSIPVQKVLRSAGAPATKPWEFWKTLRDLCASASSALTPLYHSARRYTEVTQNLFPRENNEGTRHSL